MRISRSNVSTTTLSQQTDSYTVQQGDTLKSVAIKLNFSEEALAKSNNLNEGASLRPGQLLRIPATSTSPSKIIQQQGIASGGDRYEIGKIPSTLLDASAARTTPNSTSEVTVSSENTRLLEEMRFKGIQTAPSKGAQAVIESQKQKAATQFFSSINYAIGTFIDSEAFGKEGINGSGSERDKLVALENLHRQLSQAIREIPLQTIGGEPMDRINQIVETIDSAFTEISASTGEFGSRNPDAARALNIAGAVFKVTITAVVATITFGVNYSVPALLPGIAASAASGGWDYLRDMLRQYMNS